MKEFVKSDIKEINPKAAITEKEIIIFEEEISGPPNEIQKLLKEHLLDSIKAESTTAPVSNYGKSSKEVIILELSEEPDFKDQLTRQAMATEAVEDVFEANGLDGVFRKIKLKGKFNRLLRKTPFGKMSLSKEIKIVQDSIGEIVLKSSDFSDERLESLNKHLEKYYAERERISYSEIVGKDPNLESDLRFHISPTTLEKKIEESKESKKSVSQVEQSFMEEFFAREGRLKKFSLKKKLNSIINDLWPKRKDKKKSKKSGREKTTVNRV
jgi:hypothetical protein